MSTITDSISSPRPTLPSRAATDEPAARQAADHAALHEAWPVAGGPRPPRAPLGAPPRPARAAARGLAAAELHRRGRRPDPRRTVAGARRRDGSSSRPASCRPPRRVAAASVRSGSPSACRRSRRWRSSPGCSVAARTSSTPSVQVLRSVPVLGLLPLVIIWFGIGETPKIALVAIGTTFPIYLNTYAGIRGVDAKLIETATMFGVGRWRTRASRVLPGRGAPFLVGLRFALTGRLADHDRRRADQREERPRLPDERGPHLVPHRHHRARPRDLRDPRAGARTRSCACSNDGCSRGGAASREHEHRRHRPRRRWSARVGSRTAPSGAIVLDDLDLDIARNEFVACSGAAAPARARCSGARRARPGLDGSVLVPDARSVVFQEPRLLPWRRVRANVALGLPRDAGTQSSADAALAEVGLSGTPTPGRSPCRVARPSASPWPARSCASPGCCSSTSRSARSTR